MAKKVKVYNQKGEEVKEIATPSFLDIKPDANLISKYVKYLMTKNRDSVAQTKDRSEVSGGGRKPWRQKGTGNARAGSSRSPIWVGGGVTFGPSSDRGYNIRMNTKERKKALAMILAGKIDKSFVIEKLEIKEPKTKKAVEILNNLPLEEGHILLLIKETLEATTRSFKNLPFVTLVKSSNIDALKVIKATQVIYEEEAIAEMTKVYENVK